MLLMNNFREYPDGSDILLSLLRKLHALKREQIILYFIQIDKTYNRDRVTELINSLIEMNELREDNEIVTLATNDEFDQDIIDSFWVLLHYLDKRTRFDGGDYPSEIVFQVRDEINEIIVMDDDSSLKMDYLSKRKLRSNKCRYNFLFTSGTIDDFDDELFPGVSVTLITMTQDKAIPKLTYHEVENE